MMHRQTAIAVEVWARTRASIQRESIHNVRNDVTIGAQIDLFAVGSFRSPLVLRDMIRSSMELILGRGWYNAVSKYPDYRTMWYHYIGDANIHTSPATYGW